MHQGSIVNGRAERDWNTMHLAKVKPTIWNIQKKDKSITSKEYILSNPIASCVNRFSLCTIKIDRDTPTFSYEQAEATTEFRNLKY